MIMTKKKPGKPAGPQKKEISKKAPKVSPYPTTKGSESQQRSNSPTKTWNPYRTGSRHDA